MKIPKTIKISFVLSWGLFAVGMTIGDHAAIGTAVVCLVMHSLTMEILEAINKTKVSR